MKHYVLCVLLLIPTLCHALAPEEVEFFGVLQNNKDVHLTIQSMSPPYYYGDKKHPQYTYCRWDYSSEDALRCSSRAKGPAEVTYKEREIWNGPKGPWNRRFTALEKRYTRHAGNRGSATRYLECSAGCSPRYADALLFISAGD